MYCGMYRQKQITIIMIITISIIRRIIALKAKWTFDRIYHLSDTSKSIPIINGSLNKAILILSFLDNIKSWLHEWAYQMALGDGSQWDLQNLTKQEAIIRPCVQEIEPKMRANLSFLLQQGLWPGCKLPSFSHKLKEINFSMLCTICVIALTFKISQLKI